MLATEDTRYQVAARLPSPQQGKAMHQKAKESVTVKCKLTDKQTTHVKNSIIDE